MKSALLMCAEDLEPDVGRCGAAQNRSFQGRVVRFSLNEKAQDRTGLEREQAEL